jgi:hypothetical protein
MSANHDEGTGRARDSQSEAAGGSLPTSAGSRQWRGPLYERAWYWMLGRGYFSKPFFLFAACIFYKVFINENRYQVGNIVVYQHDWSFSTLAIGLGSFAVVTVIGGLIHLGEAKYVQRARDRKAAEMSEAVMTGHAPPYFLYLRPFFLTRRMDLANPKHAQIPTTVNFYSEGKKIDLETMLERAVRKYGILLALGQPGEMLGAGRLAVDDKEWKERFEALAVAAECIFVIPSHTTGCKWEIEWLRGHAYLSRSVFIMPPKLDRQKVDIEQRWRQAASALVGSGINLPIYNPSGLLFTLNPAGSVAAVREIGNTAHLRAKVAEIRNMTRAS